MLLDYVIVAEGVGQDSRGAMTLVAVDQVALIAQTLPISVARLLIVRAVEARVGELTAGADLSMRFQVTSPSGDTVAAGSVTGKGGERVLPDIPVAIQVILQVQFQAPEVGEYRVAVTLSPSTGSEVNAETSLYVVSPPGSES